MYLSETRALALLEVLVGIRSTAPLEAYVLVPTRFDEDLVRTVDLEKLPEDWRQSPPPASTQSVGDAWATDMLSAVLRVPSAIVPDEFNFVLNPRHPDFSGIQIGKPEDFALDPRLLTSSARGSAS